ncbi:MAG: type II secretion system protein [Dehalococcoidales bacterium]
MRLPKKGEKGFTLIELLIVVAILGVLAAVVIPNVGRFIGRGEEEAAETEFANIQTAVIAMMTDNELDALPIPVTSSSTNNMALFPDPTSACGAEKLYDPDGLAYGAGSDGNGFILYQHDITADNATTDLVNYVATQTTTKFYTVDAHGTIKQWDASGLGP